MSSLKGLHGASVLLPTASAVGWNGSSLTGLGKDAFRHRKDAFRHRKDAFRHRKAENP